MPARRVTVADESDAGSVVLNYCDPEYPIPRQRDATPEATTLPCVVLSASEESVPLNA